MKKCLSNSIVAILIVLSTGCITGSSLLNLTSVEKIPLNFSYITTLTGGVTGFVSSGSIPVVDLALEQINNRIDILSNYTLNYTAILDSEVSQQSSYYYSRQF